MSEASGHSHDVGNEIPRGPLDRASAEVLARTLRALADPTRIQLLSMIIGSTGGRVSVKELVDQLNFSQPTISHHLRIMYDEGILDREQSGRKVWYSIASAYRTSISDLLR
ncbi:ArsR/SmtB family transcription factor [Arthrobacter sp. CAL618]|uniref:ArsR/SmtB family transcription factor n=1 Tax=Arthrobacter sp. CAL618 TaxID=1055770 RepID=UPI00040BBE84|nr:metalloregulator ArsR/SmtB family transcription factor [Arthrobacter sp. CAL618]